MRRECSTAADSRFYLTLWLRCWLAATLGSEAAADSAQAIAWADYCPEVWS